MKKNLVKSEWWPQYSNGFQWWKLRSRMGDYKWNKNISWQFLGGEKIELNSL